MHRHKSCDLGSSFLYIIPHRRIIKTKKDKRHNKSSGAPFDIDSNVDVRIHLKNCNQLAIIIKQDSAFIYITVIFQAHACSLPFTILCSQISAATTDSRSKMICMSRKILFKSVGDFTAVTKG